MRAPDGPAESDHRRARYVAPDGVELIADEGGDPSAPSVILLHGGGQTRHSWSGAMHALVEGGYHVINYDARGHGESGWSANGAYSIDDRSIDLLTIVGNLEGPVALVGASLGGITALHTVVGGLLPAALILVDIVPRPALEGVERILTFMMGHPEGFATMEEAADAVAAYNPDRPRPKDASGLRKNLRTGPDGRLHWHWDPRILSRDLHADHEASMQRTLNGLTRVVGLPSLLIRGLLSDIVTDANIAEFRRYLPDLDVFDVPGAGHMVAGDRNDAFNSGVLRFLARHVPVGRK